MGIKKLISPVIMFSAALVFMGTATAQTCTETQFSSTNAQPYLNAETKLLQENNPQGALQALQVLDGRQLNCYENAAVSRLRAAIKVETGDYAGAARDFESMINQGIIPQDNLKQTYFNIAQLHMQTENLPAALNYMNKWMQAGGSPDRTQKWQMAVLNQKSNNNREAIRWAEQVMREDGSNGKQEVFDFLLYLYDQVGDRAKKAQLVERLLAMNPGERRYWDVLSGEYFQADNHLRAFQVQRAMYFAGLLTSEDEIMRLVNFYNQFDAPYHGARLMEQEMNRGRITKSFERMELLANLYQVAREHSRAIPVIQEAAAMDSTGKMFERLGRSQADLQQWEEAEASMQRAIDRGGLSSREAAWVTVGQARYEQDDRTGAREAFRASGGRAGRSWLQFMDSEDATIIAIARNDIFQGVTTLENEKERCEDLAILGAASLPPECADVEERLAVKQAELDAFDAAN